MSSCCPGCAHEQARGHAEVTMCANREPAIAAERAPGTPGCSCDGLRDALAARERYRAKALRYACFKHLYSDDCIIDGCCDECERPDGVYCAAVIKEVDG